MKKLAVIQQVQLIVGSMVLLGVLTTLYCSMWGLLLCVVPAFGLINAGLTGVCPMEKGLAKMPWNQSSGAKTIH